MTPKINPKNVNGEPTCNPWKNGVFDCPYGAQYCQWYAMITTTKTVHKPCFPALMSDRDQARAERDALKAENERLKTDKTVMIASCKNCKQLKTENERLQAEWTDVPDEYENWRDFARYMQDLVDTRDDTFEKMMDQRDAALAENEQLKAENERLIGILKDWERGSKSNIESYNKLKADRDALKSENERLKYDLSEANIAINENKRGTHLILAERDAALACVEKLKDLLSEAGPLYWINEEDMDGAANWEKKVSEMLKLLSRFKGAINWQPGKAGSE